ncbi:MAG: hypothetical protein ACREOB_01930 [Thermodesulfobacteriota bacterium]
MIVTVEQVINSLRYLKDQENQGKMTKEDRLMIIQMLFDQRTLQAVRDELDS